MRFLLVMLAACATTTPAARPQPTTGTIAGLLRDHDSGEAISKASISVTVAGEPQPRVVYSDLQGHYTLTGLPAGDYRVVGSFAGQQIDVSHVPVAIGAPATVDLMFTLGRPGPVAVDYNDVRRGAIDHYKPPHLAATAAIIEGTINDARSLERVAGATITVIGPAGPNPTTQLAVSDEEGRFRFDAVPGTYIVSAYYSVNARQIEARRSEIVVAGAEAVVVPLWIEAQR